MAIDQERDLSTTSGDGPVQPHPLVEFWRYFSSNRGALIGLIIIVIIVATALLADYIAPHHPHEQYREALLVPPVWSAGGSSRFLLGTDDLGRDILSRIIYGAQVSMSTGTMVVTLALAVGMALGLVAGYFRGVLETVIMRLMDIMLALPSLLLAIVVVAILGPSLINAAMAVVVVSLPHYVRLTRAAVITEATKDYVTASRVSATSRP